MTKKEFYLNSMIQMAGNPKYVKEEPCQDDESVTCTMLNVEEIKMDAERLLSEAEKNWPEAFDDDMDETPESTKTFMGQIAEFLMDIRDTLTEIKELYETEGH